MKEGQACVCILPTEGSAKHREKLPRFVVTY